jgi:predicted short-subunit dehydrogenase-like oxidoreductase (DUF2520 family)
MQIIIIGTGNTATVMARALAGAGHTIVQVYGRERAKAAQLAAQLAQWQVQPPAVTDSLTGLQPWADLYLIAVSDSGLAHITQHLQLGNALVAHTAGAVSKDILQTVSSRYGVFYPLQSLRRERDELPPMPMLVDASDEEGVMLLLKLAQSMSGQVQVAGDAERLKLHVAAVLVNNFTNHLYALAEDFCKKEAVDFKLLLPLLLETATRVQEHSPQQVQTGPALRGDINTVERHLQLLSAHPQLQELYQLLSVSIQLFHKK